MKAATGNTRRVVLAAGTLALAVASAAAIAAKADAPAPGTYALKDGATLYVASNGGMRMFTADGHRLDMKDGVRMETRDGKVIVMKEDLNWRDLRRFGTLNPKFR
ncbi:MAG: CopK family periplasmic copper-binding protein [Betaproteobacteria bacterium]|nr:CopK family periplasmic copper-binding protein [Betaproteobacteria bacterium]